MKRLLSFLIVLTIAHALEPKRIEYAFRWSPRDGGPKTAAEVLTLLQASPVETNTFSIRYYRIGRQDFQDEIFRERLKSGNNAKKEYSLKIRRSYPISSLPQCPEPSEGSYEVDQTILGKGSTKQAYSYTCKGSDPTLIQNMQATPLSCQSSVVRIETKKFRIEEWTLPDSSRILEVSKKGNPSKKWDKAFEKALETLWMQGAKSIASSKTDLGSQCP
jgi:hypothetical protein